MATGGYIVSSNIDQGFGGTMAQVYDAYMVPLLFAPYAADLVERVGSRPAGSLLEVAAGTGALTRALASGLPDAVTIVATDLNQGMLDQATRRGISRPVTWQQADSMALPFPDASFDIVACQFGVMFFPDKAAAFAEARRVLKTSGRFLFNVWDRVEENEFSSVVTDALAELFPDDPPRFMIRIPHGYHDVDTIRRDLASGGFSGPAEVETVPKRSVAPSFNDPATALCQGTPLRTEIEARGGTLADATAHTGKAIAQQFGLGPVDGRMQAIVFDVRRET